MIRYDKPEPTPIFSELLREWPEPMFGAKDHFGVRVTPDDFAELQEQLQQITDAEDNAWKVSRDIFIGGSALRVMNYQ